MIQFSWNLVRFSNDECDSVKVKLMWHG